MSEKLLNSVRELAQEWNEIESGDFAAYKYCAGKLIALADRAEAESQREGREDERWEPGGDLGQNEAHVRRSSQAADDAVQDALGLPRKDNGIGGRDSQRRTGDSAQSLDYATPSHPQREGQQGQGQSKEAAHAIWLAEQMPSPGAASAGAWMRTARAMLRKLSGDPPPPETLT